MHCINMYYSTQTSKVGSYHYNTYSIIRRCIYKEKNDSEEISLDGCAICHHLFLQLVMNEILASTMLN